MNPISQNHDFLCKIYSPTHNSTRTSPTIKHAFWASNCLHHPFLAKKAPFSGQKQRLFLAIWCSFDTSSLTYLNFFFLIIELFTKGFPAMRFIGPGEPKPQRKCRKCLRSLHLRKWKNSIFYDNVQISIATYQPYLIVTKKIMTN